MRGRWAPIAMVLLSGCGLVGYGGDDSTSPPAACYQAISIGEDHTCVVNRGGQTYCWGADQRGQTSGVPGGTVRERPASVTIMAPPAQPYAVDVAAGPLSTCVLLDELRMWCWGAQAGTGGVRPGPAQIVFGAGDPVYRVGLGEAFGCAKVGADDHVSCWGIGDDLRTGQTDSAAHPDPVDVAGPIALAALAVGQRQACALQGDGDVWCWGDNRSGQLAMGTTDASHAPAPVMALHGSEQIALGDKVGCARANGEVRCWGAHDLGQLGDGVIDPAPVRAPGSVIASGVRQLAVMADAACALDDETGEVRCWGQNRSGELGHGDLVPSSTPVPVIGLTGVRSIAAGYHQACAEKDDALWCWGDNLASQLGRGTHAYVSTPVEPAPETHWTSVRGGGATLCAIDDARQLWCWGDGEHGQLGLGGRAGGLVPAMVHGDIAEVAVGGQHVCARSDTTVWCWGVDVLTPQPKLTATAMTAIGAGGAHSCAIADGAVTCWGDNTSGQLGDGGNLPHAAPMNVTLAGTPAAIALGGAHTCAVDTLGALWCWGAGSDGQLGNGDFVDASTPQPVSHPTAGRSFRKIAAGRVHTCAIDDQDELLCWGANGAGQLGSAGSGTAFPQKVPAAGAVKDVFIRHDTTCVVQVSGGALCWGEDGYGAIGAGGSTPRPFGTVTEIVGFGGGQYDLCAITSGGRMWCAGAGDRGQFGSDLLGWQPQALAIPCD